MAGCMGVLSGERRVIVTGGCGLWRCASHTHTRSLAHSLTHSHSRTPTRARTRIHTRTHTRALTVTYHAPGAALQDVLQEWDGILCSTKAPLVCDSARASRLLHHQRFAERCTRQASAVGRPCSSQQVMGRISCLQLLFLMGAAFCTEVAHQLLRRCLL